MDTVIENQAKAIKRNQDEEEKRLKNAYKDFDDYKARVESVLK
jgi:protein-S-isoprenylcysteine O-methyltransferase Ste14